MEVDQKLEEAQALVKGLFPKYVTVYPTGDDKEYPAEVGQVFRDGDHIMLSVWPQAQKDIRLDVTELQESPKGWVAQGPEGPVELRAREEV